MSRDRARRRAEQRAARSRPRPSGGRPSRPRIRSAPTVSARRQRRRRRTLLLGAGWVAVNVGSLLLLDSWSSRWVVLVLSTMALPVLAWLLWDPEGRVDL